MAAERHARRSARADDARGDERKRSAPGGAHPGELVTRGAREPRSAPARRGGAARYQQGEEDRRRRRPGTPTTFRNVVPRPDEDIGGVELQSGGGAAPYS